MAPLFVVLICVMAGGAGIFARLLSLRPFVFLGEISYGIYMYHLVVMTLFAQKAPLLAALPAWQSFPTFLLILLLVCAASYHWMEQPARRSGARVFAAFPSALSAIRYRRPAGDGLPRFGFNAVGIGDRQSGAE
jgi:peptidoglycan/LPS O-acetylase OafA/YrhL